MTPAPPAVQIDCEARERPSLGKEPEELAPVPVAPFGARAGAAVNRLELLEAASGADRDTGQRRLREMHRHLRLVAQALVQSGQEGAAAGEDDAAVHDVGRELGRRLVEG